MSIDTTAVRSFFTLKDFFYALFSALTGVIIGVLWAEWKWKRQYTKENIRLRANLVQAFRFNLDRLTQSIGYMKNPQRVVPNFRLDTPIVNHLLFGGRKLFDDPNLFERFNWQRYQLEHINAKLDYLHTMLAQDPSLSSNVSQCEYSSVLRHMENTQQEVSDLLSEYERLQ